MIVARHAASLRSTSLDWFACEEPERAVGPWTILDNRCAGCMVALDAYLRREGAVAPLLTIDSAGRVVGQTTAAEALARATRQRTDG